MSTSNREDGRRSQEGVLARGRPVSVEVLVIFLLLCDPEHEAWKLFLVLFRHSVVRVLCLVPLFALNDRRDQQTELRIAAPWKSTTSIKTAKERRASPLRDPHVKIVMAKFLQQKAVKSMYYPSQKNRYSREIHEVDLQFDHVISCDIELRFDIEWHAAAAARHELALHLQIEVDVA